MMIELSACVAGPAGSFSDNATSRPFIGNRRLRSRPIQTRYGIMERIN
jgi:hypothetical protein